MTPTAANLRAMLPGCRQSELIACLDRLCEENARQQRSAQQRLAQLEQQASGRAQPSGPEVPAAAQSPVVQAVSAACLREAEARIELLTRKLAAAQAELRRCQTRLFAYERETLALRRENAEMEALCQKARACGITAEESGPEPEPAASEAPRRPKAAPAAVRCTDGPALAVAERTETLHCTQAPGRLTPPPWTPCTALEKLAAQLMEQMDGLMQA